MRQPSVKNGRGVLFHLAVIFINSEKPELMTTIGHNILTSKTRSWILVVYSCMLWGFRPSFEVVKEGLILNKVIYLQTSIVGVFYLVTGCYQVLDEIRQRNHDIFIPKAIIFIGNLLEVISGSNIWIKNYYENKHFLFSVINLHGFVSDRYVFIFTIKRT